MQFGPGLYTQRPENGEHSKFCKTNLKCKVTHQFTLVQKSCNNGEPVFGFSNSGYVQIRTASFCAQIFLQVVNSSNPQFLNYSKLCTNPHSFILCANFLKCDWPAGWGEDTMSIWIRIELALTTMWIRTPHVTSPHGSAGCRCNYIASIIDAVAASAADNDCNDTILLTSNVVPDDDNNDDDDYCDLTLFFRTDEAVRPTPCAGRSVQCQGGDRGWIVFMEYSLSTDACIPTIR